MAIYENIKLEKGMYQESGKSLTDVLESLDPSENYENTALKGLDAFSGLSLLVESVIVSPGNTLFVISAVSAL